MSRRALPFVMVGGVCVTVGGLISALTASSSNRVSAWVVAYLVLVAGVSQIALGAGQVSLAPHPPSWRLITVQITLFNLGNIAVVAGTLVRLPFIVDAGGVSLGLALAFFIWGVRGSGGRGRRLLFGYRLLALFVLASIAVGLVLAHVRAG